MRASHRKQIRQEEEEESAFVSMTDMTVGFLFIMMIMLAFFISQASDPDTVTKQQYELVVSQRDTFEDEFNKWKLIAKTRETQITVLEQRIQELERQVANLQRVDPLEAYLAQVTRTRSQVLTRLRDAIRADFPNLQVEISDENDALRFQGEGLFDSGRSNLAPDKYEIVARLAERLDEVLPCFTLGVASQFKESCNPESVMIEAIQIEGHTDNIGLDRFNRTLSTNRANNTYFAMTETAEDITKHLNLKGQPVLSVSAYGPDRPVMSNDTTEGRATNRRIDLRFIMVTPSDTAGIDVIRQKLREIREEINVISP